MDLQPTDDQAALVEMITSFAADRFPIETTSLTLFSSTKLSVRLFVPDQSLLPPWPLASSME